MKQKKRTRAARKVRRLVRCCIPKCGAESAGKLLLLRSGDAEPLRIPLCAKCADALMTANLARVSCPSNNKT